MQLNTLLQALDLNPDALNLGDSEFRFKAPREFIEQIHPGDPQDPLLRQILPLHEENDLHEGFSDDPVGDLKANPSPALIHKYQGRVLLMVSPRCDIHCRYCFRRHFPYEAQINRRHWQTALEKVAKDPSIHEVILSGGDPFTLSENALMPLIKQIESIPHVRTLRIHSRTPVVAPGKAPQDKLLKWAKTSRLNKVLVVHCNHPNELSDKTATLMNPYRDAGFHLLNQSVLLKGVNDDASVLSQLSHKLFAQGILPYYLHQLDRVAGSAHFEVEDDMACRILEQLRQQLPGYLVPKLVREIAGEANKTPL